MSSQRQPSIVFVHGLWADGSWCPESASEIAVCQKTAASLNRIDAHTSRTARPRCLKGGLLHQHIGLLIQSFVLLCTPCCR